MRINIWSNKKNLWKMRKKVWPKDDWFLGTCLRLWNQWWAVSSLSSLTSNFSSSLTAFSFSLILSYWLAVTQEIMPCETAANLRNLLFTVSYTPNLRDNSLFLTAHWSMGTILMKSRLEECNDWSTVRSYLLVQLFLGSLSPFLTFILLFIYWAIFLFF